MEIGDRYNDEIKRRFPKMIRRVSGYGLDTLIDPEILDLTRLICGSEGTLAIVTRAEFSHTAPEARAWPLSIRFPLQRPALEPVPADEPIGDRAARRHRHRPREANPAYRDSTRFVQGIRKPSSS